ncbi:MAG: dihydrolipoyl dehydrogenase [Candidatus Brocadiia bacterium]|nr:MAG: dihydrolipoyl dehydrogenase [Candidatus Brocadiia bacterium]
MESQKNMYDVAVIGSGPGGYVAALRAALRGAKVCCIENGQLGGTCLNVGCIPTKAMLHASELYWQMKNADKFGFSLSNLQVDQGKYMSRNTQVVKGLRDGVSFLLKKRKVDFIVGRARLTAKDTVSIESSNGTEQIKAKAIIIATGSRPVRPGFLPWDSGRVLTTNEATTASDLPKSILILGGGVIGCEFATIYSEFGIKTTIVEMLDRLVANLDEDICKAVTKSLQKRNVEVITGTKLETATPGKNSITAKLSNGSSIEAEKILVAVGRKPNIENIGLEELGIALENGVVKVDDRCRTNIEGIYAIGDAAENRQYAHLTSRMGIIAADNAMGHQSHDDRTVVPAGIYTHPEAASVGLTEQQAKEKNPNTQISRFSYSASGMARAYDQSEGMVKLIADKDLGAILGAVVIGPHATDVIQEVSLAMRNELTVEEIAETIHPHPSFTEAVGEAAEAWLGMPLHSLHQIQE